MSTPDGGYQSRFLVPRRGVVWFERSGTPPGVREITLEPGEVHRVRMNPSDYFDIPPNYDAETSSMMVSVSCALPGLHEVPQLCRTSMGFDFQPAK